MRISVHQQVAKSPPSSSSNCQSAPPAPLPSAVRDPTVVVVDAAGHRPTKRLQRSLGREAHSSWLIRVPFTTFPTEHQKKRLTVSPEHPQANFPSKTHNSYIVTTPTSYAITNIPSKRSHLLPPFPYSLSFSFLI